MSDDMAADEVVEALESEEKKLGVPQLIGDLLHELALPASELDDAERTEKRQKLMEYVKERSEFDLYSHLQCWPQSVPLQQPV